jgi:hypothetical protein
MNELRDQLRQLGLADLAGLCLDIMEPLSPFLGQALWVMQPILGIFMDRERVGAWAKFLEDPQSLAELREQWVNDHD